MRIGKSRLCGNMAIGTVSDSLQAREILESICAHNASGEIHYGETQDNLKTAKIRFLSLEGEVICTDKPQSIGEQVDLVSGQVILVYFTHDNARWAFHSRVQKATRLVRLNANQRVVGMSIAVPHEIQLQQRRRDYRVMTVSHGIGGEIVIESEDVEFACPVERSAFSGVIHNVSVRGIGFSSRRFGRPPLQTRSIRIHRIHIARIRTEVDCSGPDTPCAGIACTRANHAWITDCGTTRTRSAKVTRQDS